jgi:hypothetical protein
VVTRRTLLLTVGPILIFATIAWLSPKLARVQRWMAANEHPQSFRDINEVGAQAHLSVPTGARVLGGEWFGTFNTYGYAKVELPPGSVKAFLAQDPFLGEHERSNVPLKDNPVADLPHNPTLLASWKLFRVRRSVHTRAGHLNSPGHIPIQLFIDLDNPEAPIAYLHWYN